MLAGLPGVAENLCGAWLGAAVAIVLVETRHTLVLQGDDGARRRVPKAGSTFALTLPAVDGKPPLVVSMRGDELPCSRAGPLSIDHC